MKITILGCGPSYGVPSFSRGFGLCDPNNPKNTRCRSAILIENGNTCLLFDAGPDIRMQLLKAGVPPLNGVIYTHAHYDHVGGTDDLRNLITEKQQKLDLYVPRFDTQEFQTHFSYLLNPNQETGFQIHTVTEYKPFHINDLNVIPILQYHGSTLSMGYRIGDFAYSTDAKMMDEEGFERLKGIKTWILGVVTPNENKKHITLTEAMKWIQRIQPERVYLTHIGARFDYETLNASLPDYIQPAYDGLVFEC